ncbi:hypothetical protein VIGAN_02222200 [Vigna angularis var. angularis]|uniref:Uncharacterized protein n=1 Tax=Vigna angularis var. angularis TaxID=157739 RepID=A0A0S3RF73_PHAAN|nr:hypothetical protein VIGAN_02222200 [Vigna angularis var. angularis]
MKRGAILPGEEDLTGSDRRCHVEKLLEQVSIVFPFLYFCDPIYKGVCYHVNGTFTLYIFTVLDIVRFLVSLLLE